ncbi:hypothetical protein [Bacillus sp. NPDC094106]|uniref:hypothetical protein n=1 Tax=Bacillus sp. NPDC094106 TaxID=3363949 RepID=UPI00381C51D3
MNENQKKAKEYILKLSKGLVKSFRYTMLVKRFDLSTKEAIDVCESLVSAGILVQKNEILCTECFRVMDSYKEGEQPSVEFPHNCNICGMEYEERDDACEKSDAYEFLKKGM